ncbi:hypothetical protein ACHHYP_17242 [Achlya hypogyna]|uniref:Uncharacterized protein n=1 Tax=Achlya hypogyna TaxID=1202772 RepID=A0A1V9Y4V5_ACHHY|nr:hypothetical protein ACHHYP_17242 [Achlya hypogyna]
MATPDALEAVVRQLKSAKRDTAIVTTCHWAVEGRDETRLWARATLLDTMAYHTPENGSIVVDAPLDFGASTKVQENAVMRHLQLALQDPSLDATALAKLHGALETALHSPTTLRQYLELAPLVALHGSLSSLPASLAAILHEHMGALEPNIQWQLWSRWPELWVSQIDYWLARAHNEPFLAPHDLVFQCSVPCDCRCAGPRRSYSLAMYLLARQHILSRLKTYPTGRSLHVLLELLAALPAPVQALLSTPSAAQLLSGARASPAEAWLAIAEHPAFVAAAFATLGGASGDVAQSTDLLAEFHGGGDCLRVFLREAAAALVTPSTCIDWIQTRRDDALRRPLLLVRLLVAALPTHPTAVSDILQCVQYVLQLVPPALDKRSHQVGVIAQVLDGLTELPPPLATAVWTHVEGWLARTQYDSATQIPDSWRAHVQARRTV